jgi:hypothetical protein
LKKTKNSAIVHTRHAQENTNAANASSITGKAMSFLPVFLMQNLKKLMTEAWKISRRCKKKGKNGRNKTTDGI